MKYSIIIILSLLTSPTNISAISMNGYNIDCSIVMACASNSDSKKPQLSSVSNIKFSTKPKWIADFDHKVIKIDNEINALASAESMLAPDELEFSKIDTIDATFDLLKVNSTSFKTDYPFKNLASIKSIKEPDFWETLYSVESKQGLRLYRPRNRSKNCNNTSAPCGHHQLSVQALKDIGCTSSQCKKDRENFAKSLAMTKKLQALNKKRLVKTGFKESLQEYQLYLIHQQGAYGLKKIFAASKGDGKISKSIKRHMANNSPYSYKSYRKMGSKQAAKKFMKFWQEKWEDEKELIKITQLSLGDLPKFSDKELQIALNLKIRY